MLDDQNEPQAYVKFTGWREHLHGFPSRTLWSMAQPPREVKETHEEEGRLQHMCESIERVMKQAQAKARRKTIGTAALHELHRKILGDGGKPSMPFRCGSKEESWGEYRAVWKAVVCIVERKKQTAAGGLKDFDASIHLA